MSNRENLRRIAALSLVIAFGMSGAAGLADGTSNIPTESVDEENKLRVELADAYKFDSYYVADNETYVYTYGYTLAVLDGKQEAFTINPFWQFYLEDNPIGYTIESNNNDGVTYSQPTATDPNFKATFSKGGMYTFTIKARGQENGPTIKLKFEVIEKTTPASATLAKINATDLSDFERVENETNTFKYKAESLSFNADGACAVSFDRFWNFKVGDEENVTDDAPMNNNKVELQFSNKDGNNIAVKIHAKVGDKVYDGENDEILTLVFDISDYVAPFALEFDEEQDKFTIETKDGKTTATYKDTIKIINDELTTVLFNKFWKFTGEGVTEKHEDIEEAKATDSDVGDKYDYKVVFDKDSMEGIKTFTVSASQVEGDTAKGLSFGINFNVEKVYTAKLSEIADDSIPSNFKRSDVDNTFIYNDELLLEDGSVQASVSPFWKFTINGKKVGTTDNYYTCDDEEFNVDNNGFIFKSAGTHTVKVYADKDHTGEGNDFVTLVFEVTKSEPEIKHSELNVSDSHEGFELGAGFKVPTYLYATELVPDKDGTCTATFNKFWNFKVGDALVNDEDYSYDAEGIALTAADDSYTVTLKNVEPGLHSIKVNANGYNAEEDGVITLVFSVAEAEPEVKNAELVIDEDKLGNFKAVEGATNTYAYPELTLSENGSCTVECERFWSFKVKGTDEVIALEDIADDGDNGDIDIKRDDDKYTFTFNKARVEKPFEVKIYAQYEGEDGFVYNGEDNDFLTLTFTVKPAPAKTPEPDYPYYPPVDPATPAPTEAPTATPAPTEAPAPTDAPTDAPTSEPTAVPAVEKQVSAGGKRLNVRSGAGIDNTIVARLNDGAKVTVLSTENGWSHIRATVNGSVIEGYVSAQYLKDISAVEPTEPANARVSTSGSALRLRASASLNAPIITRMPNGSSLKVLETVNGWCRVQFTAANGTVLEGWASSQYITVIA